ncbi:hypothetical protein MMC09_000174 [Bachmanniomyces sp. S44760]|nr:hypothetical protein [Bachmanniomyces sp. S44760]
MPRGADYDNGVAASDNAIESDGNHKVAGANAEGPSSSGIDRSHKAAPMPSGVQEMNDGTYSGDGSRGGGSGQGPKDVPVDQIAEEASSSS